MARPPAHPSSRWESHSAAMRCSSGWARTFERGTFSPRRRQCRPRSISWRQAMRRARTLREFDDVVTAPLHGFRDTDDYWTRASAKPLLGRIAVPTLLVNARNDPFLPATALPRPDEVSLHVHCDFPGEGGHAAFVSGPFPGNLEWLPRRSE